ncbi:hypothetical protein AB6802_05550 [Mesorhizobium sp. RCC_202]|uniref:hypothetical protein n=1 Tax=Mesorhizobium sp. RCC_202 TaxID=3239222 RepID=UPI003526B3E9
MRQHMLNGWLLAALLALVCLLGVTAYLEVRTELPRVACIHSQKSSDNKVMRVGNCGAVCCGTMIPNA